MAPYGVGPSAQAQLADPRQLVTGAGDIFFAGGSSGTVEVWRTGEDRLEVAAGRYPHTAATANLALYRDPHFGDVQGVAHAEGRGLFVSETSAHRLHAVAMVDPDDEATWTIELLAGDGTPGFVDGAIASARLREPSSLLWGEASNILTLADTGNHVIRAIDLSAGTAAATVSTLAGTPGTLGFGGDGGPATSALFNEPRGFTHCGNGNWFIADTGNHRVRRIDSAGTITTVIGDGTATSVGQGTPATSYSVNAPKGVDCDSKGNLFIASTTTVRMLPADESGIVDGTGPVRTIFGAPPSTDAIGLTSDTFPASVIRCLSGLRVSETDTVQVTDSCQGMLIELTPSGR